jgi:hypothetical protein
LKSRHFESGHFESGHVESGHFESGHVESWRFVTVPYHYCSIYVRSYTRRWSRKSSFKQKKSEHKVMERSYKFMNTNTNTQKKDRRFVTVPYHYCSIYVRNYTRRWSRMSSFKQKNQNTKTWSGAINLWIQIHKKRIQVPDILNQDIFGSCHVESWRFVAILFNIPPFDAGEGHPRCERGGGRVPIPTRGHTLWYSIFTFYFLLCGRACICKPFKEPRKRFPAWRVGTTTLFVVPARQATSYRPARLHRLVESISRNRFLGFINVYKYGLYWHWQLEQWRETYVSR